jgi:nicotinamidase-related amidase
MRTALPLVEVLADFRHQDGDRLAASFRTAAGVLGNVIDEARRDGMPVIYANDPAGRWGEDRDDAVMRARGGPTGDVVDRVAPRMEDRFILKPRYPAFDHTPLAIILDELEVKHVLVAGTATEMCLTQSAIDARELGLKVTVLPKACASVDERNAGIALEYLEKVVGVRLADGNLSADR